MTELVVKLSDELAQRARALGLLTDEAIEKLLREEVRKRAGEELRVMMDKLAGDGTPAMSEEAIQAEIEAYRAEQRPAKQ